MPHCVVPGSVDHRTNLLHFSNLINISHPILLSPYLWPLNSSHSVSQIYWDPIYGVITETKMGRRVNLFRVNLSIFIADLYASKSNTKAWFKSLLQDLQSAFRMNICPGGMSSLTIPTSSRSGQPRAFLKTYQRYNNKSAAVAKMSFRLDWRNKF